jgi:signal transduction histidine kinase
MHDLNNGLLNPSLIEVVKELSSPISTIRQIALALKEKNNDLYAAKNLDRIVLMSERTIRLIDEFISYYKLVDVPCLIEPVNPVVLCDNALEELNPLFVAFEKKYIKHGYKNKKLITLGNRELLKKSIISLSENAIYSSDASTFNVNFCTNYKQDYFRISIRDFGPSVPINIWEKISNNIGKTSQPFNMRPNVSSVCLLITKSFAEMMGGRAGVVRHKDGATFYIDLKLSTQLSLI